MNPGALYSSWCWVGNGKHHNTQHKDTQHNNKSITACILTLYVWCHLCWVPCLLLLCWVSYLFYCNAECHVCYCYPEGHVCFIVMLSVIVMCFILLSVVAPSGALKVAMALSILMLNVEWHYAECHLSWVMNFYCNAECHYVLCHFAECCGAYRIIQSCYEFNWWRCIDWQKLDRSPDLAFLGWMQALLSFKV
jgi:hypothetical protein